MNSKKLLFFSVIPAVLCIAIVVSFAQATQTETVNVDVLSSRALVFILSEGVRFQGSFSISGGSGNDIDFYVTDPKGSRIVNLGRVSQGAEFEFTTQDFGTHTLYFDNSFSWFNSKVATLSYEVESENLPNLIKPKNVLISIAVEATVTISLILMGIGVAVLLRRDRNKPET